MITSYPCDLLAEFIGSEVEKVRRELQVISREFKNRRGPRDACL